MRPDPTGDPPSFLDGRSIPEFESPGPLLFLPLLFIQGGGMDLSKVGEKIISSVRSARSLGLLPSSSDRPEVPARAAAAAAVARALAGTPPHEKISFLSSSEEVVSIYGSRSQGQTIDELEEDFYEERSHLLLYKGAPLPSFLIENDNGRIEERAFWGHDLEKRIAEERYGDSLRGLADCQM
ncbi:hypothetical protein MUK42_27278 [Musa troglodytarum]|uniref:Uncharacterized protein n=1 Tax=Musa troglodytarum TaxID=320322 RepID=A0A9E7JXB7_9LILI|nr:hypothetical protein MUK42_27278 [Musa troglodytarum]